MLVVVGALLLPLPPPPPPLGEVFGIGDRRTTSNYWVEQSISAHVNIVASTIVLHTLLPLSLTFTEEKPKVKGIPKGISTIKPKKQTYSVVTEVCFETKIVWIAQKHDSMHAPACSLICVKFNYFK